MDHAWAPHQLEVFGHRIDLFRDLQAEVEDDVHNNFIMDYGSEEGLVDVLVTSDPVMRDLMDAARPGLGEYPAPADSGGYGFNDVDYWIEIVRPRVLQAIGIHRLGAEAKERMRPDSPDIAADRLHPWVWGAAEPLWAAGSRPEAVHAAARSVNARLQQKLGRHDKSESGLCREAFSLDDPKPGRPRLRFSGDRTSDTWRSRQQGAMDFGAGCFTGIRNPVAHEHGLNLPEQVALEQLAAFSALARWVDECTVETAP